jgi:PHD/YefM family antitoxin component YafN of YafNO toxin-antitoxin module
MNISSNSFVSEVEMSNNYSIFRKKAESADKLFIMKNNQPDAVLFSFAKYEMLTILLCIHEIVYDLPHRAL